MIYEEDFISEKRELTSGSATKSVLLLGDSIRQGYCPFTKEYLKDIADVKFPDENCKFTQNTYVNLGKWSRLFENANSVRVIVWNNGHWDIAHWNDDEDSLNSVELYCDMLRRILKRLKNYFPNAKIIFQTTSPMNPSGIMGVNPRSRQEIEAYNKAAVDTLKDFDVLFDDAYEFLKDKPESFYKDYCHLTEDGFRELGKHVAELIKEIL